MSPDHIRKAPSAKGAHQLHILWEATKVGCTYARDLTLWFLAASVMLGLVGPVTDLRTCAMLAFLSGFLAVCAVKEGQRPFLRFVGLLPLFGFVLYLRSFREILILLPAALYLGLCLYRERLYTTYAEQYENFSKMLVVILMTGFLTYLERNTWGLPLALFMAAVLIFLLRVMRQEEAFPLDSRTIFFNLILILCLPMAALLLGSSTALGLYAGLVRLLYRLIVYPILELIVLIFCGMAYVLVFVLKHFFHPSVQLENITATLESAAQILDEEQQVTDPSLWITYVFRVIIILLFFLLALFVFRSLYKRIVTGEKSAPSNPITIHRTSLQADDDDRSDPAPGRFDRSPKARVRRAYRSYYQLVKQEKNPSPGDTSYDIERLALGNLSGETTAPNTNSDNPGSGRPVSDTRSESSSEITAAATELRRLYLLARYTSSAPLSSAEAKSAERLARQLVSALKPHD